MNQVKMTLAAVVAASMMTGFATQAAATTGQDQSQSLTQTVEVECETGAYGQTSTCRAKGEQEGEQEQSQQIVYRNGRVLGKYHVPEDTGLDTTTTAAAVMSIVSGAGAFVMKQKLG